ncbi:MAG TPA: LysR substrate-binding domain-containing protein [Planctomycetota bacterium]|jgi:LysR family hydrogen peroxide-inducible transcriptional activator|nr:LysR substrate-binding domain-containing protein [Planctomycetota bacterium]
MRPTLRQLEYFVAVAEARSFRRGAEACGVTQPALSAQIQQLERTLGVLLFERAPRKVVVTPAGQDLLPKARRVLLDADELADAARVRAKPFSGTLRLGAIPTVAPYLLPSVLPRVRRRFPDLRLSVSEERTAGLVESLERGSLDLLVVALEARLEDAETLPLFPDPFHFASAPDHALARARQVRLRDLEDEAVLLLEDGHCLRDQVLSLCEKAGARECGDFRASSLSTLVQMVLGGVGVTLLPEMAIPVETRGPVRLLVRPFAPPVPSRTIGLAWRPSSPRKEEFRPIAEEFRAFRGKGVAVGATRPRP